MSLNQARLRNAVLGALCCLSSTTFANALVIAGAPPSVVQAGALYDFQPDTIASGPLSTYFRIDHAPQWAVFDSNSGQLTGIPSSADQGAYPGITISVTDGAASVELASFSLLVVSPDGSPETSITWEPVTSNDDGSPLTNLVGYCIYSGQSADRLVKVALADTSMSSFVLTDLASGPGPHYYGITAMNADAVESEMSPIVSPLSNP
jgi:hypothetical protein